MPSVIGDEFLMESLVKKNDRIGILLNFETNQPIEIKGPIATQKAIMAISQFGLITFSREKLFKSSRYFFHFFKPVQGLRNLYNMGNEVLILSCKNSMQDFKSRTKDFLDFILLTREEYKNRLDKVTCILIDDNRNIVSVVEEDRKTNPDTRLIVPFCSQELQNGITEDEFQNRLREFLFQRDLFGIASPLTDDALFFGKDRTNIISELYGKYKQGEQGGLFGLRRIGKTSVLNILRNKINQDGGAAIYFDCSRYHHYRWYVFLKRILEKIIEEFSYSVGESGRLPENFSLKILENEFTAENAIDYFETGITTIYQALGQTRILLIFDEIENLGYETSPSQHWKNDVDALFFWQALRSIIQSNNHYFSFVVAGVNPKCIELSSIQSFDNPIFSFFKPIYISLFDYSDVKDMVQGIGKYLGLNFEEPIFAKLVDDYGGHPFLTRQICSRINNDYLDRKIARPTTVTKNNYDSHSDVYQSEMNGVIEQILMVLQNYYPNEFNLLKTIALEGRAAFRKAIFENENAIVHLLGYRIIEKEDGEYYVRIKSIKRYLEEKFIFDKNLASQEDKRIRINKRRDNIETKLKSLIWNLIYSNYGKKSKDYLINCLKGTTKDSTQENKLINASTNKVINELYFSQLQIIMDKNWKWFDKIFEDKQLFDTYFVTLNRYRNVGAHSKPISDDEEAFLGMIFKYFEERLEHI